jgi:hypothetical protein
MMRKGDVGYGVSSGLTDPVIQPDQKYDKTILDSIDAQKSAILVWGSRIAVCQLQVATCTQRCGI